MMQSAGGGTVRASYFSAIFYGNLEVFMTYFTVQFQSLPGESEMNFDFWQERCFSCRQNRTLNLLVSKNSSDIVEHYFRTTI